jgi:c-di-GMP-binding flagellar brake protein YcgR
MYTYMLTIGETLTLEPRNNSKAEQYKCRLVERNSHELFIDYPINLKTDRTVFLIDGTQLRVSFVSGHSAYSFEAEVVGRVIRGIPMIKLSFPGDSYILKVQRRMYVRIETAVDVAIHPLQNEFTPFASITKDISAGGSLILLNHDKGIKQGLNVLAVFVLPLENGEYHYLKIMSTVVRVIKNEESGQLLFSLNFMNVSPIERQNLLRFSFDRQLAMKKKGLE